MKRTLVHNPYWDTLGGGERYTASFVRFLLDRGWQVDIDWPADISADIKNRFGIDISQANFNTSHQLLAIGYRLVFWLSDGSLPTSFAAKTIIHFQFPFLGLSGRKVSNLIKSHFYTFVCNSYFTKSFIDREFKVSSLVIYPSTDPIPAGPKTNTILFVGRFSHLTQLKNPHLLIQAFAQIHKQLPGWKLVLAGGAGIGTPPGLIDSLRSPTRNLPVQIIVNPDYVQIKKLYACAKIFWSASGLGAVEQKNPLQVEHFGISVVEAMSAGSVPIITNLGGHKEIVDHGQNGCLFNTLDQLQKFTLDLVKYKSKLKTLSRSAVKKSQKFNSENFNREFEKLI